MGRNEGSELKGFLTGAFWGALIGVVCGLVIAPKTGEDTRKEITKKIKEFSEIFSDVFEEGSSVFEKISTKIGDFTEGENSVQRKLDLLKSEIEELKTST